MTQKLNFRHHYICGRLNERGDLCCGKQWTNDRPYRGPDQCPECKKVNDPITSTQWSADAPYPFTRDDLKVMVTDFAEMGGDLYDEGKITQASREWAYAIQAAEAIGDFTRAALLSKAASWSAIENGWLQIGNDDEAEDAASRVRLARNRLKAMAEDAAVSRHAE